MSGTISTCGQLTPCLNVQGDKPAPPHVHATTFGRGVCLARSRGRIDIGCLYLYMYLSTHLVLPEPWPNRYGWVPKTAGATGCLGMKPGCGCSLWLTLPEALVLWRLHILIGVGGLCTRRRTGFELPAFSKGTSFNFFWPPKLNRCYEGCSSTTHTIHLVRRLSSATCFDRKHGVT